MDSRYRQAIKALEKDPTKNNYITAVNETARSFGLGSEELEDIFGEYDDVLADRPIIRLGDRVVVFVTKTRRKLPNVVTYRGKLIEIRLGLYEDDDDYVVVIKTTKGKREFTPADENEGWDIVSIVPTELASLWKKNDEYTTALWLAGAADREREKQEAQARRLAELTPPVGITFS